MGLKGPCFIELGVGVLVEVVGSKEQVMAFAGDDFLGV